MTDDAKKVLGEDWTPKDWATARGESPHVSQPADCLDDEWGVVFALFWPERDGSVSPRAKLAALAPRAIRMLVEIEMQGVPNHDEVMSCVSCGRVYESPVMNNAYARHCKPEHTDNCELAAILREAGAL